MGILSTSKVGASSVGSASLEAIIMRFVGTLSGEWGHEPDIQGRLKIVEDSALHVDTLSAIAPVGLGDEQGMQLDGDTDSLNDAGWVILESFVTPFRVK